MKEELFDLLSMEIESEDKDGNPVMVPPEFLMKVQTKTEDGIHVIVHPLGHGGITIDLVVNPDSIAYLGDT